MTVTTTTVHAVAAHAASVQSAGSSAPNDVLLTANIVLAIAAVATAIAGMLTIKSSNRVAEQATEQAKQSKELAKASAEQANAMKDSVEAALDQVALAQGSLEVESQALLASMRPVVVEVPKGHFMHDLTSNLGTVAVDDGAVWRMVNDDGSVSVGIPVRNIGPGPAFVREAMLSSNPGMVFEATVDHQVIPSAERALITCEAGEQTVGFSALKLALQSGSLKAMVRYSDVGGTQRTQSVVQFRFALEEADSDFAHGIVEKLDLYGCDDHWIPADIPFNPAG